ncbi:acid phosphatase [Rhizosaccharibacter radicis]|uniref:Phosphatase PAP2 family protein n=1 Tax=Rhizosaccharibacter radicis TaxID=2782605 RepID=A0ABT1VYM2_9PROT|nr:phosphatase PAP2 family protein [Acetobacteraceae bacterium KSS12]
MSSHLRPRYRPSLPWVLAIMAAGASSFMPRAATAADDPAMRVAPAGAPAAPQPGEAYKKVPPGYYLQGAMLPDTLAVLPPPPLPGSPEQAADDAEFRATRTLERTPRWALASNDAKLSVPSLLSDFSCALGTRLDPARMPKLVTLVTHGLADMTPEIDKTKDRYGRKRPYLVLGGDICTAKTDKLAKSPSYPSGHTTIEYGLALILAQLAPDRAAAILQRGRVLGESRIVCGVHWVSDVQGGVIMASSLVSALDGNARFRTDLDAARSELDAARRQPVAPDAATCAVEADAAAHSPLFRLQTAP